jgi:hypothetical protein
MLERQPISIATITPARAANPNFRASRFSIPPYTISPPKSYPFLEC